MKSLNKLFLVLLAMLAVGFVSMGFSACSDDDDDEPGIVAVFKGEVDEDGEYDVITFYDDNSFAIVAQPDGVTWAVGTYTGDPNTAGATVKIMVTKVAKGVIDNTWDTELVDIPAELASELNGDATISADGKTATYDDDTYTRQ